MTPAPPRVWTYTYRLDPPQSTERLRAVKALLDAERLEARDEERTFDARLVADERIADILVVSDSPRADHPVNEQLERALRILGAGFERTTPFAIDGEATPVARPVSSSAASPTASPTAPAPSPRLPRKK